MRGISPPAQNARKDVCDQGHEFSARRDSNRRACRTCDRERAGLVKEAREILGLTDRHYRSIYGQSRDTAKAIIESVAA